MQLLQVCLSNFCFPLDVDIRGSALPLPYDTISYYKFGWRNVRERLYYLITILCIKDIFLFVAIYYPYKSMKAQIHN